MNNVSRKNLAGLLKDVRSRTIIIITAVMLVLAIAAGVAIFHKRAAYTTEAKLTGVPGSVRDVPGSFHPSIEYTRLLEQQNRLKAERAQKTGGSAIPTIVREAAPGGGEVATTTPQPWESGLGFETLSRIQGANFTPLDLALNEVRRTACTPKVLKEALERGATVAQLKAAGCNVSQLIGAGLPTNALQRGGLSACDLSGEGLSPSAMKNAGYSAGELKGVGFNACQLKLGGFSAQDLVRAGFSPEELKGAGFSTEEIGQAPSVGLTAAAVSPTLPPGISADQLKQQGCTPEALRRAKASGISAAALRALGCPAEAMKAAGFSAAELKNAGFSAGELKAAGFTPEQLRQAGYDAGQLKAAGFSAKELADAGFTPTQLQQAGYTAGELKKAGFSNDQLKAAGFNAKQLADAGVPAEELRAAGFEAAVTPRKATDCSVEGIRKARARGVTAAELRRMGCSIENLKGAGYSAGDLRNAGYSAGELRAAGYGAKDLKDAGFNAAELKGAGFAAKDLNAAGFTPGELRAAGYTAGELRNAGFTPEQLRAVGYNASELKAAGYTPEQLKRVGFSPEQLRSAGISIVERPEAKPLPTVAPPAPRPAPTIEPIPGPSTQQQQQLQDVLDKQQAQITAQQRDQMRQQLTGAISAQASQLFAAWVAPAQAYVIGTPPPEDKGGASGVPGRGGAGQALPAAGPIIKAGTIMFAVLDTEINSDEPGPVLATIVYGPLKDAKLIGSLTTFPPYNEKVMLNFNLMTTPSLPRSITVNAVAIDQDTARTALSSHTNHHYLLRYGSLFAASFLEGYGQAFLQSGQAIISTAASTTVLSPSLSPSGKVWVALGNVGNKFGSVLENVFNRPPTVHVCSGTALGILFLQDTTLAAN